MAEGFQGLRVWQEARQLARAVYELTDGFPSREQYGLSAQLRRSAVSIMSNIAEGQGRYTRRDFANFLYMARGSLMEVQSCITLAHDLGFVDKQRYQMTTSRCHDVGMMLNGLISAMQRPSKTEHGARGTEHENKKR